MPGFNVLTVASDGIERALRCMLMAIAAVWLAYLAGTVALVVLEVFWWGQLEMREWSPDWLRAIIWIAFTAPASLALLRVLIPDEPGGNSREPLQAGTLIAAVAVLVMWDFASIAAEWAQSRAFLAIWTWAGVQQPPFSPGISRQFALLAFVSQLPVLVAKAATSIAAIGLLLSLVLCGRLEPMRVWRWVATAPIRLLLLAILVEALNIGLKYGINNIYFQLGSEQLRPLGLYPWRAHVWSFMRYELIWLPKIFVAHVLPFAILAEGFRHLMARHDDFGA